MSAIWHSLTVSPWDDLEVATIIAATIAGVVTLAAAVSAVLAVPVGAAIYAIHRWGPSVVRPWRWNTYCYGVTGFAVLAVLGKGWLNVLFAASCAGLAWFSEHGWA